MHLEVAVARVRVDSSSVNLNILTKSLNPNDGGPSMGLDQEPQDMLGGSNFSSNVKGKVLALLNQLPILPGDSSMRKPGFFYLLEGDPEGIISCMPHPLEA